MNTKELWILNFEEFLWQHHTCNWDAANRNPDYPYQLACAYFDWGDDGEPACKPLEAFKRHLEADK